MNASDQTTKKYARIGEDADPDHLSDSDEEKGCVSANAAFQGSSWNSRDEIEEASIPNSSLQCKTSNKQLDRQPTNSFEEVDDDDWNDDEAGLRRYKLDFKAERLPSNFSPAEFDTLPKRLWMSFLDLRAAARQRQAARLLNMPSESFQYKCHSFCMTLCDATDQGIFLVVALIALWLLIGLAAGVKASYWLTGMAVFLVRVSARRVVEYLQGSRFKQHRLRLSSIELGGDLTYRNASTKDSENRSIM